MIANLEILTYHPAYYEVIVDREIKFKTQAQRHVEHNMILIFLILHLIITMQNCREKGIKYLRSRVEFQRRHHFKFKQPVSNSTTTTTTATTARSPTTFSLNRN